MAAPPYLTARSQNGTNCQVYRLLSGTTLSRIPVAGVECGSANMETLDLSYHHPMNRTVEFEGKVFQWQQDKIYEVDVDTDLWDLVYTVPTQGATQGYGLHTGLYHADVNEVHSLIGFYEWAGPVQTPTRMIKYTAASGWTVSNITGSNAHELDIIGEGIVYRGVFFHNKRYTSNPNENFIWSYDPTLGVYASSAMTNAAPYTGSFAVLGGEFYFSCYSYATSRIEIYRYVSGAWAYQFNVGVGSTGQVTATSTSTKRVELVSWGGVLYLCCFGRIGSETQDGLRIYKYTTTGGLVTSSDETDLNAAVPSSLRSGVTDRGVTRGDIQTIADYDTNPTSPSLYFVFIKDRSTGTWVYYEWEGESTQMSNGGTIGAFGLTFSQSKDGGGERIWTEGSLDCTIQGRAVGNGGLKYTFSAEGDPLVLTHGAVSGGTGFEEGEDVEDQTSGATATIVRVNTSSLTLEVGGVVGTFANGNVVKQTTGSGINSQATQSAAPTGGGADYKVQQLYNPEEEAAVLQGTLTGVVSGGSATRNGNWVENVTADGVIQYTFVWNFFAAGMQPGAWGSDKLDIQAE